MSSVDAGPAQALRTEFASGVPNDTLAGSRLVFRFVTHIGCLLDYIYNPIDSQFLQSRKELTVVSIVWIYFLDLPLVFCRQRAYSLTRRTARVKTLRGDPPAA